MSIKRKIENVKEWIKNAKTENAGKSMFIENMRLCREVNIKGIDLLKRKIQIYKETIEIKKKDIKIFETDDKLRLKAIEREKRFIILTEKGISEAKEILEDYKKMLKKDNKLQREKISA